MRRLIPALIAGLVLVAGACSSSDDASTATSTTTSSSVVVAAANRAACDSAEALQTAIEAPLDASGADPVSNATNIKAYLTSLVAPLEAFKAVAPAEIQPSVDILIVQGQSAATMDPNAAADQQALGTMLLFPSDESKAANEAVRTWTTTNCGVNLQP